MEPASPRSSGDRPRSPAPVVALLAVLAGACSASTEANRLGTQLLKEQKPEEAVTILTQAIAEDPEDGALHLSLGRAYLALGKAAEAEAALGRAAELGEKPQAHLNLARLRHVQGRFKEAVELLQGAMAENPNDSAMPFELGLVLLDAGDNAEALKSFTRVTEMSPRFGPGFVKRATALGNLGRYSAAVDLLEKARERLPQMADAPFLAKLGEMYEAVGRDREAELSFRRAFAADPKNVEAMAGHARHLWAAGDHVHAIEILRQGAGEQPGAALLHLELGLAYDDFRVSDKALEELFQAVAIDYRLERAYEPLLRLVQGDPNRRNSLYPVLLKAAKIFPNDIGIQLQLAREGFERKMYDGVIAAAGRVIKLKPAHLEGNYLLGMAQVRSGDREAALETQGALAILDAETAAKLGEELGPASKPPAPKDATADRAPPAKAAKPAGKSSKKKSRKRKR